MKTTDVAAAPEQKQGFFRRELSQWFGNVVGDLWGGAVTTFALLPEVIGFMIVAGVHPYMGLFTCICLTVLLAFIGGRPGMISAGAGATALILAGLIKEYGMTHPEYIFAAVILAGLFQFILGVCRVGSLVKFIPQSVMHGFVNGFAIVILVSQLKLCIGRTWEMYILIAAGIAIIVLFPFLKKVVPFLKKVPESFVAIVLITAYALIFHSNVTNIGDMGDVTASFQYVGYVFTHIGGIFTSECFLTILPTALSIAFVGLIESMLTSRMVDDETQTTSNKNRECRAQGIGNMVCGMVGAMPGCGMIAMTVTNLKAGGKGRLSQFVAGVLMAALLFTLPFLLESIPLAALCAVMFVVVFHTINWDSILHAAKIPVKETVTMALTAIIVIATNNLAMGVGCGLVLSAIFYLFHRFTSGGVQMGVSYGCLGAAVGLGISGLLGFSWGYAIAMVLCAIGVGLASMARNESGKANLKVVSTVSMVLCIAVGVAVIAGASIGFHMGPWYTLMDAAQSAANGESTLYVK
ncbi:MAG: SulP family inorganic anion transporter [Oscillospiraceae bacterium]|nr:SulP family inorganic anion transporter [Oscillospiraceae bacterium]